MEVYKLLLLEMEILAMDLKVVIKITNQMETIVTITCLVVLAMLAGLAITQLALDLMVVREAKADLKEAKDLEQPDLQHHKEAKDLEQQDLQLRKVVDLAHPTPDQVRIAAILVQAGMGLEQAMAQAKEILNRQKQPDQKAKGKQT